MKASPASHSEIPPTPSPGMGEWQEANLPDDDDDGGGGDHSSSLTECLLNARH